MPKLEGRVKRYAMEKSDRAIIERASTANLWGLLLTELRRLSLEGKGESSFEERQRRVAWSYALAEELRRRGTQLALFGADAG